MKEAKRSQKQHRMTEKETNRCVAEAQSQSRAQPDEMLWCILERAVHKQMPTNLNEMKRCLKHCVKPYI